MGSFFGAAPGRSRRWRQVPLVGKREVGWERRWRQEQITLDPPGLISRKSEPYRPEGS